MSKMQKKKLILRAKKLESNKTKILWVNKI